MNFTFALSSIGFVGRFIIAFIILAYLYTNNKDDQHIRKGFKTLCIAGAVVFVLLVVLFFLFFVVGGIGLLGNLFDTVRYHNNFTYNFPY
ncbi:MAG: hypothetical protein IKA10_06000 [Oscillospiraceae bacterium]|nr:hypothetical protein [Oscillospiraceae bacterium]